MLSTIVPKAAAALAQAHPGHRAEPHRRPPGRGAADAARAGRSTSRSIFRYADTPVEDDGFRLVHLVDDPIYLSASEPGDTLADHRDSAWIGGCERCRAELDRACVSEAGFTPRIAYSSDDMVVMQTLVAAGMGVATLPGLALQAHRTPGIHTTELVDDPRQIYVVTYGDPPDPPATAALITTIQGVVQATVETP